MQFTIYDLRVLLLKTSDFISTDRKLNSKGGGGIDFNALKHTEREAPDSAH